MVSTVTFMVILGGDTTAAKNNIDCSVHCIRKEEWARRCSRKEIVKSSKNKNNLRAMERAEGGRMSGGSSEISF